MLTKEQAIAEFDFSRHTVTPDRLSRLTHAHYLPLANEMVDIYNTHVGCVRKTLHDHVRCCLQDVADCPARRIAAFCKLLDDASEFQHDEKGRAAQLRRSVFSRAASLHPLVKATDQLFDHEEAQAKSTIAAELGRPWAEIEADLFADVIEFHRLVQPPTELDGAGLLARYNVAQTQAALYGALSMHVSAGEDFKFILRYAKLARLMHTITRRNDRYELQLTGPASVLRQTRRYGVSFAKFLPGLLAASDWQMQATVLGPAKHRFTLRLTSNDGLRSDAVLTDFDSQLEAAFAGEWETLANQNATAGWTLRREATILHHGQTVFLPDFTLTHPVHGEVLLEIIGFWTPEYLTAKAAKLDQFRNAANIVLAVSEAVDSQVPELGFPRITYSQRLRAASLVALLNQLPSASE